MQKFQVRSLLGDTQQQVCDSKLLESWQVLSAGNKENRLNRCELHC